MSNSSRDTYPSSTYKGDALRITITGASHAPALNIEIEGLPQGLTFDTEKVASFMARRAPGNSSLSTARREPDVVEIVSGAKQITPHIFAIDGSALSLRIENMDTRSGDYESMQDTPRPGHADYAHYLKTGEPIPAGGGAYSGRMTAALCAAGAIALQELTLRGTHITGTYERIGSTVGSSATLTPDMIQEIETVRADGDSIGGTIRVTAAGYPAGIGGPIFDGLESTLAELTFAIPAVKSVEFGGGAALARLRGSVANDQYGLTEKGDITPLSNNHGGILGGISTGSDIVTTIHFKPTPSIAIPQQTVNTATKQIETISVGGRHDPSIVVRALPVCEAVVALGLLDKLLTEPAHNLETARATIDRIDSDIIRSIIARSEAVKVVAAHKSAHGSSVEDPTRERAVINRVAEQAGADFALSAKLLFSTIFDISKAQQSRALHKIGPLASAIEEAKSETPKTFPQSATVACQGVEGSHAQAAADRLFALPNIFYLKTFEDVFKAVEQGMCQYGVLPIENSTYGSVTEVYELMRQRKFFIARSIKLHISHCLLVNEGAQLSTIKKVYSHEQAIGQCSEFLASLGDVEVVFYKNTAAAAKAVAESGDATIAAVAASSCAGIYGLSILRENIQNNENNYTRFICISRNMEIYPGAHRVSLMFSVSHKPGELYRMLARFSVLGINLTKIESRPIPGSDFEFLFYFDLEADIESPEVVELLDSLAVDNEHFIFLGAYSER